MKKCNETESMIQNIDHLKALEILEVIDSENKIIPDNIKANKKAAWEIQ